MKKYFKIFAGVVATALITAGCEPLTYAQTDNSGGNYDPNGYNYDNGYGDGQPGDSYSQQPAAPDGQNYQYPQQPADPNSMAYQQQPAYDYQQSAAATGQMSVGFNDFYSQLSPYGSWVNIAPYGQVWVANVPNFQPYSTNGYWTYTTYGWTWVSNYPWGWAPFHYGRWGYNNVYGWYWVPGYNWGPAWVAWSSCSDMYGWAPLMPGMNFSVGLSLGLFPSSYWTFMSGRYMGMNNISGYFVNRSRNVSLIRSTTLINNFGTENNRRYTMGPRAADVQKYTGRTIQPMRVTNASDNKSAGVGNNELRVYRPVTRTSAPSNRTGNNAASNNRAVAPQARTQQAAQSANRAVAPQTRTTQQAAQQANRAVAPQARTESAQSANRAVAPQTRTQQAAQPAVRAVAPQTTATQPTVERAYQPNPAQPKVTNTAAPQRTRQIQAAQKAYQRVQQRPATQTRTNTNNRAAQPKR